MTISAFSDELAQGRTKKKEFLNQIERIVPWKEWPAMIQPCYYSRLILKKGTIVDSTIISAPSSTKNKEK